jgi:hypothetical protein
MDNQSFVFNALYSMHCILCILLYALYSMHCILCIVFYALYSIHCILCIVFYALYSVPYTPLSQFVTTGAWNHYGPVHIL